MIISVLVVVDEIIIWHALFFDGLVLVVSSFTLNMTVPLDLR